MILNKDITKSESEPKCECEYNPESESEYDPETESNPK